MSRSDAVTAIALVVAMPAGERFFCGFSKDRRIQTAWSLAGAELFGLWRDDEIRAAVRRISARGYRSRRVVVGLYGPGPGEIAP